MLPKPTIEPAPTASAVFDAPATSVLWRVLLSNLPFVLALALGQRLWAPLLSVVVGAIMFLVPGLAWTDRRYGDAAVVLFRVVLTSLAASFVSWIVVLLPPGPTPRAGFLLLLAAVTNVGLWLGTRRGWYDARPFNTPLARVLTLASALFYAQSYLGAVHFVPALEDQDMELQATAYGLIHHAKPTMTTNDASIYYFAHPLLLHFLIGESALISEDLENLRYYHDGSLAMGQPPSLSIHDEQLHQAWWDKCVAHWEEDYAHFLREPLLAATRTPNMFLSAFLLFPLGFLAYRLAGTIGAALVACALYMTLPEVYVRSSYGGYMAIANFLCLAGGYFYLAASGLLPARADAPPLTAGTSRRSAVLAAFLGGWADQKTILLPLAASAHAGLRAISEGKPSEWLRRLRERPEVTAAVLVTGGFFAGWLTYIAYGLAVNSDAFIMHHLQGHFLDRIALTDLDFVVPEKENPYPSVLGLWQEFADHTGYLVVGLAVPALLRATKQARAAEGFALAWIIIGAVGFSLVDWRQTKHLAQCLQPFVLLIGVFWSSVHGKWKPVLNVVVGAALIWNVWRIGLLMRDFEYIKPLPMW